MALGSGCSMHAELFNAQPTACMLHAWLLQARREEEEEEERERDHVPCSIASACMYTACRLRCDLNILSFTHSIPSVVI